MNVVLEGHSDETGITHFNYALGLQRAVASKKYLTSLGVSPTRMKTFSFDKVQPDGTGPDETQRMQNVHAVIMRPAPPPVQTAH